VPGFDEVIDADASDFERSGLKVPSYQKDAGT
jgi:hypothetical protein